MSPNTRWGEVERIVRAVLDLPPEERGRHLAQACHNDPALRHEVERLLQSCAAAETAIAFLDSPAAEFGARVVSEVEIASSVLDSEHLTERLRSALTGRYVVEREVGRGGMGTVFLAHDVRHRRRVAVKVMRAALHTAATGAQFLREIQTLAGLNHPHILPLHDSGEADGLLYYVTPYVDGESLRARMARGPLPLEQALRLLHEVAAALAYAHRHDVVHRDIKPENILLQDDHAIIADFGIARAIGRALESGGSDLPGAPSATSTGAGIGTPAYMAPEQAAAIDASDHRADLYALGVIAWEMLAGAHPFGRATAADMLMAHRTLTPELLRRRRADVPAAISSIIERLLAKKREERYQSADLLLADLSRLPASRLRLPRSAMLVVASAGVAALLLALLTLTHNRDGEPRFEVGVTSRITHSTGVELDPALSPDGKVLAFATGRPGRCRIYTRDLASGRSTELAPELAGNQRSPNWSPDGAWIALVADERIMIVAARSGSARVLRDHALGYASPSWSPDGKRIAFSLGDSVRIVRLDGGSQQTIQTPPRVHSLSWSPDGTRVALVSQNTDFVYGDVMFANVAPTSVWIIRVASATMERITPPGSLFTSPTWLPDGRSLLYVSAHDGSMDIYYQALDKRDRPHGSARRVTTGLNAHSISLSRDGTRLVYSGLVNRSNIFAAPISRFHPAVIDQVRQLTDENQIIETVAVTSDGRWLAYDSDHSGKGNIYKMPSAGGPSVQLTWDTVGAWVPQWSRDGRRIAFHSWRYGNRDVFVLDVGTRSVVRVTSDARHEYYADWDPAGRRLAFIRRPYGEGTSERIDGADYGLMRTTEESSGKWSPAELLLQGAEAGGRWTHDGRYLVYGSELELMLYDLRSKVTRSLVTRVRLGAPIIGAAVGTDTTVVYFVAVDSAGVCSFYDIPVSGGSPRLLLRLPASGSRVRGEFATDSRNLYFALAEDESDVWMMDIRKR